LSNFAVGALILLVIAVIISNIYLVKKSAKFGLKNKDGSEANSKDSDVKRKDNNKNWDDED